MEQPTVLRNAKFGGFVKEDVLRYLDEKQTEIDELEKQLEQALKDVSYYKAKADQLHESLETANNDIARLKEENERLKGQLA